MDNLTDVGTSPFTSWYSYDAAILAPPYTDEDVATYSALVGHPYVTIAPPVEYVLDRQTEYDVNMRLIKHLQETNTIGYVSAIAVGGPNELFVLHRGPHRCCNAWCGGEIGVCGLLPIIQAPILYWIKDGQVLRTYGANFFHFPHCIYLDPDEMHIWIVDQVYDQVFRLNLATGNINMVLGSFWSELWLYTTSYPADQHKKGYYFGRLIKDPKNFGLLCSPTNLVVSQSTGLVFVGSGYCDARVVVFNATTGEPVYSFKHITAEDGIRFLIPHDLLLHEEKQQLLIANREVGLIDIFDMGGAYLASWDLRVYGMGRPASIRRRGSRLLTNLIGANELSGAIVELNWNNPGVVIKAYSVPIGNFPQHFLDFWEDDKGGLHIYISSPYPEYYYMSSTAHAAEGVVPMQIVEQLRFQYISILLTALIMPISYFIWLCWAKRNPTPVLAKQAKKSYTALDDADDEVELAYKSRPQTISPLTLDTGSQVPPVSAAWVKSLHKHVVFVCTGQDQLRAHGAYAGKINTPLTPLGIKAAQFVGKRLQTKGAKFDHVYASYLQRGSDAASLVLRESQPEMEGAIRNDMRIGERDYGILSGRTVRVAQRTIGQNEFNRLVLNPNAVPLEGESIQAVLARVVDFLKNEVEPKVMAGQKVLVVTHHCPLEVMACYISGKSAQEYLPLAFRTSTPISVGDLLTCYKKAANGGQSHQSWSGQLGTLSFIYTPLVYGFFLLLRAWMQEPLWPDSISKLFIMISLCGLTVLGLAELDIGYAFKSCCRNGAFMIAFQTVMRVLLVTIVLLWHKKHAPQYNNPSYDMGAVQHSAYVVQSALFWLMPPTLMPGVARNWGGGLFLSTASTIVFGAVMPLVCVLYRHLDLLSNSTRDSLRYFWLVYALTFWLPLVMAWCFNKVQVPESDHLVLRSFWVRLVLWWLLAVACVQIFTPDTIQDAFGIDLATFLARPAIAGPLNYSQRYSRNIMMTAATCFVLAMANVILMRLTAWVSYHVLFYWEERCAKPKEISARVSETDSEQYYSVYHRSVQRLKTCNDCYLSLTFPNIFMYASLILDLEVGNLPIGQYMVFITTTGILMLHVVDQMMYSWTAFRLLSHQALKVDPPTIAEIDKEVEKRKGAISTTQDTR